jgi:hypothetical protein
VQDRPVALIVEGAQHLALVRARVGKERERVDAVAGEDDGVEALRAAVGRDVGAADRQPLDAPDGRRQAGVGERGQHAPDVDVGAARNGTPARPAQRLQQPVVAAKARHRGGRHAQHLLDRARPDAGEQRQQVPVAKALREAMRDEEVADRIVMGDVVARARQGRGVAIEARDLAEHVPEREAQQIAGLREDASHAGAAPFDAGGGKLGRERHLGRRRGHAEVGEQGGKARRGAVVEDREADVDAVHPARRARRRPCAHGRRTVGGFEEGDPGRAASGRVPPRARRCPSR